MIKGVPSSRERPWSGILRCRAACRNRTDDLVITSARLGRSLRFASVLTRIFVFQRTSVNAHELRPKLRPARIDI
jgi:hypothetical protein